MSTHASDPLLVTVPLRSCAAAVAQRELALFPAEHVMGLPLRLRFVAQMDGFPHPITFDSCIRDAAGDPSSRHAIVFDGAELRALAVAARAERLWPKDLKAFCLMKLHDPSFRVTLVETLDGAQPEPGSSWSLGRVLDWLELTLTHIEPPASEDRLDTAEPSAAAA